MSFRFSVKVDHCIRPVQIFRDPFRGGKNILVLCATYKPQDDGSMTPLKVHDLIACHGVTGNNERDGALAVFNDPKVAEQEMWFGLEQEYTLYHADKVTPLGWPKGGFPGPQGPYYCSAGVDNAFGRDIAEAHLKACLVRVTTVFKLIIIVCWYQGLWNQR